MKPADVIHVPNEPPKNEATSCLHPFSRLLAIPITFWFNACSIVKLLSFSSAIVGRFSGLGADFVFNSIPHTLHSTENESRETGRDTDPPIDPTKAGQASGLQLRSLNFQLIFFKIYLVIYLFLTVLGLPCRVGAFLCGEREPLSGCGAWVSHCGGFSCGGARVLGLTGFSSCGTWAQQLQFPVSSAQAQ